MSPFFLLIVLGLPALGQFVSTKMRKRFVQYSQQPMPLSGREIAELMLAQRGIENVRVISTPGKLTDHYDPRNRTVNLSEPVYNEKTVAATAVAAHECGHAVQHATNYPLLTARSKMVPMLKVSNMAIPVLMFGGAGVSAIVGSYGTAALLVAGMGLPALFSLVTLPVEFDASKRALRWMSEAGLAPEGPQYEGAKKALFWAAMTYVVSALGAIVQALYFARMFLGRGGGRMLR